MGKYDKLLIKVLSGNSDSNIKFNELTQLLLRLGFHERIKGVIKYITKKILKKLLIFSQSLEKQKNYQVNQIRKIILKHGLKL